MTQREEPEPIRSIIRSTELSQDNILLKDVIRDRRKKHREAIAIMAGKVLTAEDISNQSFYSAFFSNAKSISIRIKASDLPPEPKT